LEMTEAGNGGRYRRPPGNRCQAGKPVRRPAGLSWKRRRQTWKRRGAGEVGNGADLETNVETAAKLETPQPWKPGNSPPPVYLATAATWKWPKLETAAGAGADLETVANLEMTDVSAAPRRLKLEMEAGDLETAPLRRSWKWRRVGNEPGNGTKLETADIGTVGGVPSPLGRLLTFRGAGWGHPAYMGEQPDSAGVLGNGGDLEMPATWKRRRLGNGPGNAGRPGNAGKLEMNLETAPSWKRAISSLWAGCPHPAGGRSHSEARGGGTPPTWASSRTVLAYLETAATWK
jgi:hypothetical protein